MQVRARIEAFIKMKGPSLPVHIARDIGISILFAGAYLSDLLSERILKISDMKVGGSPLYFIPGQENMLENYSQHLGKLKDAFALLKEKGVLRDEDQIPMIRVALRALKDFALPFEFNGKLYWKYLTLSDGGALEKATNIPMKVHLNASSLNIQQLQQKVEEVKETIKIEPQVVKQEVEIKEEIKEAVKEPRVIMSNLHHKEEKGEIPAKKARKKFTKAEKKDSEAPYFEQVVEINKQEKPEKLKEKSKFVANLIENLVEEDIELIEELGYSKNEYKAKVKIDSTIGKMDFFLVAKDKKINETDLALAIQDAQVHRLPALVLGNDIMKKAEEYLKIWKIVKFKKI